MSDLLTVFQRAIIPSSIGLSVQSRIATHSSQLMVLNDVGTSIL